METTQPAKPKAALPVLVFGTLAFLLFGAAVLLLLQLTRHQPSYDEKRAQERADNLRNLRVEEARVLNNFGWVDKDKGVVRIPVALAAEKVLPELKAKPVGASSVKVPPPPPPADAAAAPAPGAPPAAPAVAPAPAVPAEAAPTPAPIPAPLPLPDAAPAPTPAAPNPEAAP